MNHRHQFSLLIVRGDGTRLVRINVPRRITVLGLVGVMTALAILGALVSDWQSVRHRMRDAALLFQQIEEQQATIESVNSRIADLRKEVATWRELHARIWEPFGPDLAPRTRATGIGGGHATPPDPHPATLSPTDQLHQLSLSVSDETETLRHLDRLMTKAKKVFVSLPSRWPVRGGVSSEFGRRLSPWTKDPEFHGGLDISADRGTPVRAPAAAQVFFAGAHGEFGLTVILDHGQEIRTIYGHLSKILVAQNQRVERGTEIALTGNTGRSSGPHLHYEILVKGQPVNPRAYLWD
jgi:murein DD-endopeptidase MepM/ murein hydrolase activator NlpD